MHLLGGRCLALINAGAGLAVMVGPAFCMSWSLFRAAAVRCLVMASAAGCSLAECLSLSGRWVTDRVTNARPTLCAARYPWPIDWG
jgi:hypothetical protein